MKTKTAPDGTLVISDIQFNVHVSMQTHQCIVLDDILEPDAFKMVSDWLICETYSCGETLEPWSNTWRWWGKPPACSKSYLSSKGPFLNYVDVMDAMMRETTRRYPQYTLPDWKDIRIHAQLSHAGTKLAWHSDHHSHGSFTYYPHPKWLASWGGEMLLADCPPLPTSEASQRTYDARWEDEKVGIGLGHYIMPKPNRLVLVAPRIWHSVNRIDQDAGSALRVAVVGFLMKPDSKGGY